MQLKKNSLIFAFSLLFLGFKSYAIDVVIKNDSNKDMVIIYDEDGKKEIEEIKSGEKVTAEGIEDASQIRFKDMLKNPNDSFTYDFQLPEQACGYYKFASIAEKKTHHDVIGIEIDDAVKTTGWFTKTKTHYKKIHIINVKVSDFDPGDNALSYAISIFTGDSPDYKLREGLKYKCEVKKDQASAQKKSKEDKKAIKEKYLAQESEIKTNGVSIHSKQENKDEAVIGNKATYPSEKAGIGRSFYPVFLRTEIEDLSFFKILSHKGKNVLIPKEKVLKAINNEPKENPYEGNYELTQEELDAFIEAFEADTEGHFLGVVHYKDLHSKVWFNEDEIYYFSQISEFAISLSQNENYAFHSQLIITKDRNDLLKNPDRIFTSGVAIYAREL